MPEKHEAYSGYTRKGKKLTNAQHSKVVDKQIRYQTKKAAKKTVK